MNICFNLFEVVVHRIFLLQSSLLSLLGLLCVSIAGMFCGVFIETVWMYSAMGNVIL